MSISAAPTPPLLLTKRLSAFLHAHQSPPLPTLLLITPHGKLLAHASPLGVSLLRIHATVAASLFTIHTGSSAGIPAALPGRSASASASPSPTRGGGRAYGSPGSSAARSRSSSPARSYDERGHEHERERDFDDPYNYHENEEYEEPRAPRGENTGRGALQPGTITVQLTGGTVVIRRLACGLLFVCVGPPAHADPGMDEPSAASAAASAFHHQQQHGSHAHAGGYNHLGQGHAHSVGGSSPSEADSAMSGAAGEHGGGAGAGQVTAMRRRAGELARRLDEKLGTLKVPADGGVEMA